MSADAHVKIERSQHRVSSCTSWLLVSAPTSEVELAVFECVEVTRGPSEQLSVEPEEGCKVLIVSRRRLWYSSTAPSLQTDRIV